MVVAIMRMKRMFMMVTMRTMRMGMMGTMRMMMPVTWAVDIWRRSATNWLTTGREDGEMLGKHVVNDDVVVNGGDDVDYLSGERVPLRGSDLTQENASLRNSGGQSGQSAENALYSTPKF